MSPFVRRAVGGIADREGARDRVGPYRRDPPVLGEGGCDRGTALGLPAVHAWLTALDEPELEQLLEAPADLRVHGPGRDRRDDGVRELPAELLGDLVAERLRALRVVGPQSHVDEAPGHLEGELDRESAAIVVGAAHRVDRRAVHRRRDELLGLEIGRAEDCRFHPLGGGPRCDRVRQVASRRAGERVETELLRLRAGDRDDTILERMRRVCRVELQVELSKAERRGQTRRRDERREPGREARLRRRLDRKQRRVAPDRERPLLERGPRHALPQRREVIDGVQRPEVARAHGERAELVLSSAETTA